MTIFTYIWRWIFSRKITNISWYINSFRPRRNKRHLTDDILKFIFLNENVWISFWFHWRLFLRFELTIFKHWLRWWLGADQATSHYLNEWWLVYWCIYASLSLNELKVEATRSLEKHIRDKHRDVFTNRKSAVLGRQAHCHSGRTVARRQRRPASDFLLWHTCDQEPITPLMNSCCYA